MKINTVSKLALVVVLISGIAYVSSRFYFDGQAANKSTQNQTTGGLENSGITIQRQLEPGKQLRYRLSLSQDGMFETSKLLGASSQGAGFDQEVKSHLQGEWIETILSYDNGRSISYVSFEQMQSELIMNKASHEMLNTNLLEGLAQGVYLERDRDLNIRAIKIPSLAQPAVKDIIYSLVRDLQVVIPEGVLATSWTSEENDIDGQFEGRYKLESGTKPSALRISKTKVKYLSLSFEIENSVDLASTRLDANTDLTIDYDSKQDQVLSLTGHDERDYYTDNSLKIGSSRRQISFTLMGQSQLGRIELEDLRALVESRFTSVQDYDTYAAENLKQQITSMHQRELGTDDLTNILDLADRMKKLEGQALSDARLSLYLKLKALIYLYPENLDQLTQAMTTQGVDSLFFAVGASSMVAISSPESQKALVDLSRQFESNMQALQTLLPSLGFVKAPLPLIEEALREFENHKDPDIRSNAELAMGVHIGQLKLNHNDQDAVRRFKALEQEKLEKLKTAGHESDISQQLSVIGNFGSESSLQAVIHYLSSPSAKVRSNAVAALRFINNEEALNYVTQVLIKDADAEVRFAAADALGYFTARPVKMKSEMEQVRQEKVSKIRIQLLQNLSKDRHLDPVKFVELITQLAQSDQDSEVRYFAEGVLIEIKHSYAAQK